MNISRVSIPKLTLPNLTSAILVITLYWMGKRRKKTKITTSRDRQLSHERFMRVWESITGVSKYSVIGLTIVGTAFCIFYLPLTVAPGETTIVTSTQKLLANVRLHVWLAWGTAAAMGVAWKRERRMRLEERIKKDSRIRKLEGKLDPNVTSSNLNLDGTKEKERNK